MNKRKISLIFLITIIIVGGVYGYIELTAHHPQGLYFYFGQTFYISTSNGTWYSWTNWGFHNTDVLTVNFRTDYANGSYTMVSQQTNVTLQHSLTFGNATFSIVAYDVATNMVELQGSWKNNIGPVQGSTSPLSLEYANVH